MGFHTFVSGEVLTAANVNSFLMNQTVISCTAGTRPGSPVAGMTIYQTDTAGYWTYTGTAWVPTGQAHGVQASKAVGANFTASTWLAVQWDVNDWDTDTFHSTSVNNTRLVVPANMGGKYAVFGKIVLGGQASGNQCQVMIGKNSAGVAPATPATKLGYSATHAAGANLTMIAADTLVLAAGDYVEFWVFSPATTPSFLANDFAQSCTIFAAELVGT